MSIYAVLTPATACGALREAGFPHPAEAFAKPGADALALLVSGKIELTEKGSAVGRLGLQPTDIFAGHGDDTYLCHVPLPGKALPLPRHVEAELRDDVIHLRKIEALAKREVARMCRSQDWLTHEQTIAEIRVHDGRSSRHPAKAKCLGLAAFGAGRAIPNAS